MKFDMSIDDNYASFKDDESDVYVFVDSFDNKEFEVRIGTIEYSKKVGLINTSNSTELNDQLATLFRKFQGA